MASADAPSCAAMVCDSEIGRRYGFEPEAMRVTLEGALARGGELFVAESEGRVAGFVWMDRRGAFSSAPYLRLVAVDGTLRGSGLGARLLAEFEGRGAEVGRDYCLLVSDFNVAAQAFYERHGYRKVGELSDFAREGIAEIFMVKRRKIVAGGTGDDGRGGDVGGRGEGRDDGGRRGVDDPCDDGGRGGVSRGGGSRGGGLAPEVFADAMEGAIADGLFTGASLRIERAGEGGGVPNGGVLFEGAWGDAIQTEEERIPMRVDTAFDIASITKLFTTTAVLRLATLGRLSLDSRLDGILDAGQGGQAKGRAVGDIFKGMAGQFSIASFLAHSTGIHYWYPFYTRRGETFEAILSDIMKEHPPRNETIYSDLNFMLLGRLVEVAAGKPLDDAIRELIFEPLGLGGSSWRKPLGPVAATEFGNRIEEGMVASLGLRFDGWRDRRLPIVGEPNDGNCHYYFGGAAGHAGIFSVPRDLCRLGRLYLEGGRAGRVAFLDPALAAEAMRDRGAGRGLGFQLGANYPGGGCGHTGFTGSYLHLNKAERLVIVLFANRLAVESPGDINPFRRKISALALAAFGGGDRTR
ncbi:MAG: GNAT family N-acetyltransferase [Treponema sp.]|nr:GNAT family N-acetyltransferase [Treponema sp.]